MRLIVGLVSVLSMTGVYADCASELDDAERLSCFDRLAQCQRLGQADQRLACYKQGGPTQAATSDTPAPASDIASAVEAAFPAPRARDTVEEETPEIHSSIVALQKDARGYFYLTLANGHVWREKENVRNRYKEGDLIVISKGALNSNQLRIVDKGRMVRVERYK
ncbi:hypothetical protein QWY82_07650 [Simiduia curdlanivorans]|uniref:Type IV pilus biogenesis protein PilP n=1 Tax=Simiduia curdlanivorans TaxID=1492769 RepID=A0ABV8V634_9GAMM|nr:hypothetical protein [Simiduia curdlanivorans]MDN3638677.1 hypothetical protein [Simiduia curdlanivorans]